MTAAPITADKGFDAARLIMDRLDEQPVYDAAPDLLVEPVCEELGYGNSKHTCETLYNCCDCGNRDSGCGCAYCWSCRACNTCYGDADND